jgi:hypothetical protein
MQPGGEGAQAPAARPAEGDKYEYLCPDCGSTCGDTIQKDDPAPRKLM